jgi:S-DNA-T family DNA segregation ATPase FtsK/SpoIIIE
MPNDDWQALCQRGRVLREDSRMLTGHAAGQVSEPVLDHAAVAKAIGAGVRQVEDADVVELPEPLASVVDYLGEGLDDRSFVPTAELVDALDVEPTVFGRRMGDVGCRPTRGRITSEDGTVRQVRGYLTADIRAAIKTAADAELITDDE